MTYRFRMAFVAVAIFVACITLAACAHPGTVRVNVPVACVDPADVPARPAPLPRRPADARAALDVALAKLVELLGPKLDGAGGYVGRSSALLAGCTKNSPAVRPG